MLRESFLSKRQKIGIVFFVALIALVMFVQPCFADDPFSMVTSALHDVYSALKSISTGIAVVGAVCALLVRMFAKNPQAKSQSTAWLIGIVVAWICIQCLEPILNYIAGLFGADSTW